MKKLIIALTVLAFSAGLVGVASADGWTVKSFGKMQFISLATADSTTITLELDPIAAGVALAESTAVLDIRQYTLHDFNLAAMPNLGYTVYFSGADNAVASVSGDSIQVIPMYSYDGATWVNLSAVTVTGVTPTEDWQFVGAVDENVGIGAGFWRWMLVANDRSATASRQAWIKPHIYIAKNP